MSDENTTSEAAETAPEAETSKPEIDWKAKAREWESKAKANKTAADELASLKASQMSEQERLAAQLTEATRAAEIARAEALRFRVAASHGISDEDAEIFLTGADEDSIKRQAERLVALRTTASTPGTPRPDMSQGATSSAMALNGDDIENALRKKLGIT